MAYHSPIIVVFADHRGQVVERAGRFHRVAARLLRAGLGLFARRPSRMRAPMSAGVDLVVVVVDLHHRRRSAVAHAFDLGERPQAVIGDVPAFIPRFLQAAISRPTAQHARRGAADLHVETADRRELYIV
jgi:hypothetical protein